MVMVIALDASQKVIQFIVRQLKQSFHFRNDIKPWKSHVMFDPLTPNLTDCMIKVIVWTTSCFASKEANGKLLNFIVHKCLLSSWSDSRPEPFLRQSNAIWQNWSKAMINRRFITYKHHYWEPFYHTLFVIVVQMLKLLAQLLIHWKYHFAYAKVNRCYLISLTETCLTLKCGELI